MADVMRDTKSTEAEITQFEDREKEKFSSLEKKVDDSESREDAAATRAKARFEKRLAADEEKFKDKAEHAGDAFGKKLDGLDQDFDHAMEEQDSLLEVGPPSSLAELASHPGNPFDLSHIKQQLLTVSEDAERMTKHEKELEKKETTFDRDLQRKLDTDMTSVQQKIKSDDDAFTSALDKGVDNFSSEEEHTVDEMKKEEEKSVEEFKAAVDPDVDGRSPSASARARALRTRHALRELHSEGDSLLQVGAVETGSNFDDRSFKTNLLEITDKAMRMEKRDKALQGKDQDDERVFDMKLEDTMSKLDKDIVGGGQTFTRKLDAEEAATEREEKQRLDSFKTHEDRELGEFESAMAPEGASGNLAAKYKLDDVRRMAEGSLLEVGNLRNH